MALAHFPENFKTHNLVWVSRTMLRTVTLQGAQTPRFIGPRVVIRLGCCLVVVVWTHFFLAMKKNSSIDAQHTLDDKKGIKRTLVAQNFGNLFVHLQQLDSPFFPWCPQAICLHKLKLPPALPDSVSSSPLAASASRNPKKLPHSVASFDYVSPDLLFKMVIFYCHVNWRVK